MVKMNRDNISESFSQELEGINKAQGALFPLENVTNFTITTANNKVAVKWKDPDDLTVIAEDGNVVTLSKWAGTKLVYKKDSMPLTPDDGVIAIDSTEKDTYNVNGFIVDNLEANSTYHFMLFPYSDTGQCTISTDNNKEVFTKIDVLESALITDISSNGTIVNIKWTDPVNVVKDFNGGPVITAEWAGTRVVRKLGSMPTHINDGVLVVDSKIRDAYKTTGFDDSGLEIGAIYYYRVFPYTTTNITTEGNVVHIRTTAKVPGNPTIIAGGTTGAGFFGEVAATELITGDALALNMGLTIGTSQYSDTSWLKFVIDGKILFTPKKPIRNNISWKDLSNAGVINGNKTIKINGNMYKVRLWKGAKGDKSESAKADYGAIGSEWNRLMLPIHVEAPNGWKVQNGALDSRYAGVTEKWANYTNDDLVAVGTASGAYIWCQEIDVDTSLPLLRGGIGISFASGSTIDRREIYYGWRPVLELIPPTLKDTYGSPGNAETITRGETAGFFGEVPATELITGDALAAAVKLTNGTSINSNSPWLKFILDGKILFIPKKPFRHSVSWSHFKNLSIVNGSRSIKIGNHTYKIRLIKGVKITHDGSLSDQGAIGSEWNRLMLPIHVEAPNKWTIDNASNNKFAGSTEDWGIDYTDNDLLTNYIEGKAYHTICQEMTNSNVVVRGYGGVSYLGLGPYNDYSDTFVWRPVLELVPPPLEDITGSPGATKTIGNGITDGFFGEVTANELITGDILATTVGLSVGTSINSNTNWLKFIIDGKILFTPKKPIRNGLSWKQLNEKSLITGNKIIDIGGIRYKVRLWRGTKNNPAINEFDSIGSEWNRLMLPIHVDAPDGWKVNDSQEIRYGGLTDVWGNNYVDTDLSTQKTINGGLLTICQEYLNGSSISVIVRGCPGISASSAVTDSATDNNMGWRPVLEVVGPFEDKSGSPGPTKTIAQGTTAGFFGEVPVSEFITGNTLSSVVGLTSGALINSDMNWLKFSIDGKIIFTPKKPIRNNVSWNHLNAVGLINGDKTIKIGDHMYKVRLWKGLRGDSTDSSNDGGTIGSEWNRLMLPIHNEAPDKWTLNGAINTRYGDISEDWGIDYTDIDLSSHYLYNGFYTWCQEKGSTDSIGVLRAYTGISGMAVTNKSTSNETYGWRPVLELIQN